MPEKTNPWGPVVVALAFLQFVGGSLFLLDVVVDVGLDVRWHFATPEQTLHEVIVLHHDSNVGAIANDKDEAFPPVEARTTVDLRVGRCRVFSSHNCEREHDAQHKRDDVKHSVTNEGSPVEEQAVWQCGRTTGSLSSSRVDNETVQNIHTRTHTCK